MSAGDNYQQLRDGLPQEVTLVAVSKYQPLEKLREVYDAGCRDFGESRVQEALEKQEELPGDIRWHLIGTLQRKKVSKVVGKFALIHSVDSLPLAQKISEVSVERGVVTSILIQVNVSGEEAKHGFPPDADFQEVINLPGLDVQGLMTMAPLTEDEAMVRKVFSDLRGLRDQLGLRHLSMGMSHDYPIALEEGASLIRVGSSIFS